MYYFIHEEVEIENIEIGQIILVDCSGFIKNVRISETYVGIRLAHSSNVNIQNATLFENLNGIHLSYSENNVISDVISSDSNAGCWLDICSSNNILKNNFFNFNEHAGLLIYHSSNNNVYNNTFYFNVEKGLYLHSSNNNLIYHNNFINNSIINAQDSGSNTWDNGYPSGGNYWSDYTGIDDNNDGIGDIPYNISNGDNQDLYPLINPKIVEDINQSTFDRGFPIRHAVDGDWAAAQSFIPTLSTITGVDVYLRKFGTPEFNLTIELRTYYPQGTLIDTLIFTPSEISTSFEWLSLDFIDTAVIPGIKYFIVCPPAPVGVTTSFGYEWGYAFGNQYDDGAFWFTRDGGGLWRGLPTMYEFAFRTYGYD